MRAGEHQGVTNLPAGAGTPSCRARRASGVAMRSRFGTASWTTSPPARANGRSWVTRPLIAGVQQGQRPATPGEGTRGGNAPGRVVGSAGEGAWLRSILSFGLGAWICHREPPLFDA